MRQNEIYEFDGNGKWSYEFGATTRSGDYTVNADGALVAIINVDGNDITVVFAPKSGRLTVVGSVGAAADAAMRISPSAK